MQHVQVGYAPAACNALQMADLGLSAVQPDWASSPTSDRKGEVSRPLDAYIRKVLTQLTSHVGNMR